MAEQNIKTQPAATSTYPMGRAIVVLPTYDERENIADLTQAILSEQAQIADFELHVLISDGHSQDGTMEIAQCMVAENARVHFIDVNKRGIGAGLYTGFMHAINELDAAVIIEMDSDFQH